MAAPTTYSEWAALLDAFGRGDDAALEQLGNGSFTVDAGTAVRFYSMVESAYKKRKQTWLDTLERSFQLQRLKTEEDFAIALRNSRQNLAPLSRFVVLKGIPPELQKTLRQDLENFVAEIRTSLKDNITATAPGREKRLLALQAFGLPDLPAKSHTEQPDTTRHNSTENLPSTGRKILFHHGK
jgi:hypothetical protein